MIDFRHVI